MLSARLSRALTVASAAAATAESLQLRQLQVIHRHGDRTPITPLADRAFWSSILPSEAELTSLEDGTTVLRPSGSVPHPAAGDGLFGTLSLRGVQMMREVGAELRRTYPSLLHEDLPLSADDIRVHSTDFPRTVQSVQALLQGLSPLEQRGEPIPIDCTLGDKMIPDPVPRATEEQAACEATVLRSDAVLRHAAEVEPLRLRYSQALLEAGTLDPRAYELSGMGAGDEASTPQAGGVPGPLSWNKLAEVLTCMQTYKQLPPSLTDEDVREASAAGAYRWRALMAERRVAHLAMGAMAAALVSAATEAAEGACENDVVARRLQVWSGHDSTLFGLLAAFELDSPSAWPPCAPPLAPSHPRTLAPSHPRTLAPPRTPLAHTSPMHAPSMPSSLTRCAVRWAQTERSCTWSCSRSARAAVCGRAAPSTFASLSTASSYAAGCSTPVRPRWWSRSRRQPRRWRPGVPYDKP